MNEPCAVVPDGEYRIWLKFDTVDAVAASAVMDGKTVSEAHSDLIEVLLHEGYPHATTEDCGLTMKVHGLGVANNMTAIVWVSEAQS